ncbi:hypothetical protein CXB49_07495 [Chromobacterium sp. ATCC 53434]|nr:hypothetical protein CXB49_07495 [Chromobacterium sp. ATCC 53434]
MPIIRVSELINSFLYLTSNHLQIPALTWKHIFLPILYEGCLSIWINYFLFIPLAIPRPHPFIQFLTRTFKKLPIFLPTLFYITLPQPIIFKLLAIFLLIELIGLIKYWSTLPGIYHFLIDRSF